MTAVIYIGLLYLLLNLNLDEVFPALYASHLNYLVPTLYFRVLGLLLHSFSWYFILKVFRKDVPPGKLLAITLAAIFTEVAIPVGGVTEVAKVLLASQILLIPHDEVISAILMHRILLTIITGLMTIIAINVIKPPIDVSLTILAPIVGLLTINVLMLLVPSSYLFRKVLNKLANRFNMSNQDFTTRYKASLKKLFSDGKSALVLATAVIVLEKFSNGIYGISLCRSLSYDVDFFTSIVVFDSIYMIIWLLPVVTPGNLGIFEAVQVMVFKLLGTSLKLATLIALVNRAVTLITEIPLMLLSTTYLGVRVRHLLRTAANKRN